MSRAKLERLSKAEAKAYADRYQAACAADDYEVDAAELFDVECCALDYFKVAGWYLDDHGLIGGFASLHKPLGDGSDDLLFGRRQTAIEYARKNPLS